MEIISEPEYIEETVTDIDLAFVTGTLQLTLRKGDTYKLVGKRLTIRRLNPPETLLIRNVDTSLLFERTMKRVMRRLVKGPSQPAATRHVSTAHALQGDGE